MLATIMSVAEALIHVDLAYLLESHTYYSITKYKAHKQHR